MEMAELRLMTSHGNRAELVFSREHGVSKLLKDYQSFPANCCWRQEIVGALNLNLSPIQSQLMEQLEPSNRFLQSNWCIKFDSALKSPVITDIQDRHPSLELFNFPTSEKLSRHQEVLHFHGPQLNNSQKVLEDVPLLANLLDLQIITNEFLAQKVAASLIYPNGNINYQQPLLDFIGDLAQNSRITIQPNGWVEFIGSRTEMNDLLSFVTEFYSRRNSANWRIQSLLVPHYNKLNAEEAQANSPRTSLKLEALTVPPMSPEKATAKPSPSRKKSSRKARKERDMYKRNSFHAFESLLSLLMDKKREGKLTTISLKKVGPELPELLNQLSAGIAGAGIAVLSSVLCKLASSRVPFCSSKFLSFGLGFGLVWLSWTINRLSSTLLYAVRKTTSLGGLEEEIMERVDRTVKEIYFGAATIMAVAVLRLV
ncbi:hypothetical protein SAY87_007673 [Trapa incisa]|uniref:Uncharacterized protein n=1 Tax=Trapa incisa TaxID=236973 RepID=A0AAN7KFF6_9MYRT|nr:hypothetical protein SAY87_007673 [Trapa incisa]